ncbi:hypothetical protein [Halomonas binhaiensis]|uniref:Uncharacterized protein n=1 Tax=Halomonas binhaiensis TaxID=2562282 RepID=A0A5C1NIV3_9GAMM|nr:hypothetical protein [Halomonas binhaiensis]QEM82691.1 hypothetical protein E4T21_14900 [Halomonas binhaiensis]
MHEGEIRILPDPDQKSGIFMEGLLALEDTPEKVLELSKSFLRLVEITRTLLDSGGIAARLLWPGKVPHPGLAHLMANLVAYEEDSSALRTLIYPASLSRFNHLNNYILFGEHLRKLANEYQEYYLSETGGLRYNTTLLLFALARLPWVYANEVLPTYHYRTGESSWPVRPGNLFRESDLSHLKAGERKNARALMEQNAILESPMGLLSISGRVKNDVVTSELRSLFANPEARPNLVIFDARRIMLNLSGWDHNVMVIRLAELVSLMERTTNPPGLLILTDTPSTWRHLQITLKSRSANISEAMTRIMLDNSAIWATPRDHILTQCKAETLQVYQAELNKPYIIDTYAANVIQKLYRLPYEMSAIDRNGRSVLKRAASVLGNISALTLNLEELKALVPDATGFERAFDRIDWRKAKRAVLRWARDANWVLEDSEIEAVLNAGDKLIEYWKAKGQPFAQAVRESMNKVQGNHLQLVVGSSLEAYAWNQAELAGLEAVPVFQVTAKVGPHIPTIYTALTTQLIDELLLSPQCDDIEIVLTPKYVRLAQHHIEGLLASSGLEPLKPAIERLLSIFNEAQRDESFEILVQSQTGSQNERVYDDHSYDPELLIQLDHEELWYRWSNSQFLRRNRQGDMEIVKGRDLRKGDQVLSISDELREELREILSEKDCEVLMSSHQSSGLLSLYHREICHRYESYPAPESQRFGAINEALIKAHPNFNISRNMLCSWLAPALEEHLNGRAHAPQKQEHFNAFCNILGVPETMQDIFWQAVRAHRGARRRDGRVESGLILMYLMKPEAIVYLDTPMEKLQRFRERLLMNFSKVTDITPLEDNDDES